MSRVRTWTDTQLRAAVASAKSYRAVLAKLGLRKGSTRHVAAQIERLQLDTSHFDFGPVAQLCSDDRLRAVVADSRTCTDVLRALGVELHTNNFVKLRRRITVLGLDTSHFLRERDKRNGRRTRWTDDELRAAVASAWGYAETIRKLGLIPAGGNYDQVRRRIGELSLDTSHFRGRGWNVEGKYIKPAARPLEELLVANRWTTTSNLKQRLIRAGLKAPACELCGWAERTADGRVPVELDHINGDKNDNRLENLRILCPNCHSLQPTHRGLNQKIAIDRRAARLARTEPKR
ncbi:MAG: HNH endonuclease [Acidobacteriota bacterium]